MGTPVRQVGTAYERFLPICVLETGTYRSPNMSGSGYLKEKIPPYLLSLQEESLPLLLYCWTVRISNFPPKSVPQASL